MVRIQKVSYTSEGKLCVVVDGFTYSQISKFEGNYIFRCVMRKCPAIVVSDEIVANALKACESHNHSLNNEAIGIQDNDPTRLLSIENLPNRLKRKASGDFYEKSSKISGEELEPIMDRRASGDIYEKSNKISGEELQPSMDRRASGDIDEKSSKMSGEEEPSMDRRASGDIYEKSNKISGEELQPSMDRRASGDIDEKSSKMSGEEEPSMDQYTLNKYLQTIASYQQQFPSATLPNIPGLQPSMMQPGTSFQSLPASRIPSPHHQFQRQSPPQSYNRNSPNFQSPPPAHMKRSASVSSRQSREESVSPIHQNSWSFEEQFKQLYDIDRDDPKRKEFLDDLFSFMQKHGKHKTPVTRLPIMAKSVLDLYELYKLVVQRGGLVDVINKKLWQEVIKGLNLPSSITSAAFTLRTQYMKFLYRYECHKLDLSKPHELQAAIEGNKREGRRTSYYGDLGQMHSPNSNGPNNGHPPTSMHHGQSQMSPVSLVTTSTSNTGSNRLQMNGHSNQFASHTGNASIPSAHGISPLILQGSSPELPEPSNLSGFMTQLALWNLYNGAMKTPLQQPPVLPFQPARPPSQNSNNEAPLDLGKNRKEDRTSLELPAPKREARDNDADDEEENETEDTDSDSDDEPECQIPLNNNSSQDTENTVNSSPVVVKIKINGTKYRGVLHPRVTKRPKVGPLQ